MKKRTEWKHAFLRQRVSEFVSFFLYHVGRRERDTVLYDMNRHVLSNYGINFASNIHTAIIYLLSE